LTQNYDEARRKLIESLRQRTEIRDTRVLKAMSCLDRHLFVDGPMRVNAYEDRALPIGVGQTISQPYIVALMTQMLELTGRERVLEIGTGSGYQAALLSLLCHKVFTVERHHSLLKRAKTLFEDNGFDNIICRRGDGSIGWESEAPFDRIIMTAGAPDVSQALASQLSIGGIMVLPVGNRDQQELKVIRRTDTARFEGKNVGACRFVPLIGLEGWKND
jgi:protein-L-isoaspartate(D-aspartate) O-methyltransferase